jgi:hypothetical protein
MKSNSTKNKKNISVASILSLNKVKVQEILKQIIDKVIEEVLTCSKLSMKTKKTFETVASIVTDKFSTTPEETIPRRSNTFCGKILMPLLSFC